MKGVLEGVQKIDYEIYQRLRDYCLMDLGKYINGPEYDGTRKMLSKLAKGEVLGRMEHENQRATHLFQCHDLTPRERSAAHLLGVISNYRMITWFTEATPPNGHQQLPPLEESKANELRCQANESIAAYICYLPEREASALLSAWIKTSPTNTTPKTVPAPLINKQRRNILDSVIETAITQAGNTKVADVFLKLKDLALAEEGPFTGTVKNDALEYTNDNNELAELRKEALRQRLYRRSK